MRPTTPPAIEAAIIPTLGPEEVLLDTRLRPISLSHADIRRTLAGLPASRRHSPQQAELGPRGVALQRLSAAETRVRPLSSLGLAFADADSRTRSRHACDFLPRLDPLHWDGHHFWQCVGPAHGSDLLPRWLLFAHKPSVPFCNIAGAWKVRFASARLPSRKKALSLSHLSVSFIWLIFREDRQSRHFRADPQ